MIPTAIKVSVEDVKKEKKKEEKKDKWTWHVMVKPKGFDQYVRRSGHINHGVDAFHSVSVINAVVNIEFD